MGPNLGLPHENHQLCACYESVCILRAPLDEVCRLGELTCSAGFGRLCKASKAYSTLQFSLVFSPVGPCSLFYDGEIRLGRVSLFHCAVPEEASL